MGASAVSPHEAHRDATCHGKVLARRECLDSAPVSCTFQNKAARVALEGRRCSPASLPLALAAHAHTWAGRRGLGLVRRSSPSPLPSLLCPSPSPRPAPLCPSPSPRPAPLC